MLVGILVLLIVLQVINAIGSVALIGYPREPRTKGEAIASIVLAGLLTWLYIVLIYKINS